MSWGKVGSQEVGFATCVVSRRKGAGRDFQLGAKLAHLAEALLQGGTAFSPTLAPT